MAVESGSNYCILSNHFTLGPLDINNPLGTRAELNINFSNALITYSNTTNIVRRYNGGSQFIIPFTSSNIIIPLDQTLDINCNVKYTISNLLPDVSYTFNVRVNTTRNPTYGLVSSNATPFRTLLPPYPPRLTTVTQCNDDVLYPRQGFLIYDPTSIFNIYNSTALIANGGLCNIINNRGGLAILTDKTPGTNTNIISVIPDNVAHISVICEGIVETDSNRIPLIYWTPTLLNHGIELISPSGFSVINIRTQQQDPYQGNTRLNRFYLQASNVSVIIRDTFLQPSTEAYTYSIIHCNFGYSNIISTCNNIYVDNLSQLTSVESLTTYSYTDKYISGLRCLYNNQIFNFDLDLQNFISYFIPACNILIRGQLSYTSLNNNTYNSAPILVYSNTTIYDRFNTAITSSPAPTDVRLQILNIDLSGNNDIFFTTSVNSQITVSLTIENLLGTTNYESKLPYYFDTLSINNLSINHSNSSAIGGERQRSYGNTYIDESLFESYDDFRLILDNPDSPFQDYNNELPLVGGFYGTGAYINNCNYFNDFDMFLDFPTTYFKIKTEDSIRYATFKYSLFNSSNIDVRALEFNMNIADLFIDIIESSDFTFNTIAVPTLHYKVYNVGGDPTSPINTGWLDGNIFLPDITPLETANARDGYPGLLQSVDDFTINNIKRYWNIIPIPANTSYDVYVKIGLQNLSNLYFDYIYLISKYITVDGVFYPPTNEQFEVITPPTYVRISWVNPTQDAYDYTEITGNYNNTYDPKYPRRVVNPGDPLYVDDEINAQVSSGDQYFKTLSNADTYYEITLRNISVNNDLSDPVIFNGKTDLPPYTYCNFYDGNMKFKFYKESDDSENIYFTNCNAYYVRDTPRIIRSKIITKQELSIKLVRSTTQVYEPFIINYSNSSISTDYPGPGLSDFSIFININNNTTKYDFNNNLFLEGEQLLNHTENNINLLFESASDMTTDSRDKGFFYKSFLNIITLDTLINGSNNITMSNNFGNNYSQNFLVDDGEIEPTVNNMFVDTTSLTNPAYYTYISGILVFRTDTALNYNFWMKTSNLNSQFIMPTPITFALQSNSVNVLNLTVSGANVIVYSNSAGVLLNNSFVNATNNTFFSWPNVSLRSLINTGPTNRLNLVGTAFNLFGASAPKSSSLATESELELYFDNESLRTISRTDDSNFYYSTNAENTTLTASNNFPNAGKRVISGTGLNPGSTPDLTTFGNDYVHSSNILTGIYINELQIVNGYFTGSNQNSYLNYSLYYSPLGVNPDYRTITTTNNIRWATFMWYIPDDGNKTAVAKVSFNNHNFTTLTSNVSGNTFYYYDSIYFFYKINGTTSSRTSEWINGNLGRGISTSRPTRTNLQTFNIAGGVIPPSDNLDNLNNRFIFIGDSSGRGANSGNSIGRKPFTLYIRIGYPVNCNFDFKNIRLESITQF